MNFGFFGGIPELARSWRSRFYGAEPNNLAASGQNNNYQTIEVNADDVSQCGLHIMVKGAGAALIATSTNELVSSDTRGPILAGNSRGSGATDWQRVRNAQTQVAGGAQSVISGGQFNTANGSLSVVSGGDTNTANGGYSWVPGGRFGAPNGRNSGWAWGCEGSGAQGRQQRAGQLHVATTTAATAVPTNANGSATAGTTPFTLANNSAVLMNCRILARDTAAANDVRAWDVELVARRGANAAATTVDFTNIVSLFNTAGAAAWTIAVVADTTVGAIYFSVTGEAGKTIRWVVSFEGVEVA